MADFILCRSQDSTALARQLQARLGVLGLTFAVFSKDTSSCLLWRESANEQHESFFRRTEAAWILCSGLFAYQEEAGSAGLSAFLEAFDPERPSLAGTQGQFSLIFKKAEALYLCNDPLGTNKIYHNADLTLFSNLFIAVAEGQPNPSLDLQGCYEYVWNGVPAGEKTFFQEVRTLPHGFVTVLAPREPPLRLPLPALDLDENQPSPQSLESTASLHLERLRNLMINHC